VLNIAFYSVEERGLSWRETRDEDKAKTIVLARKIIRFSPARSTLKFLPFPPGDHMRRQPHISKARKMLGWALKVGLDQRLSRTAKWFRDKIAQ
jgi:nucleoside-diphosphate-sugar epimerase